MTILERIVLLVTGGLAAYQIVIGVEGFNTLALWAFSLAFGVVLVAGLLMIILGFEVLNSPLVIVVAALLPLSFSLGMVAEYFPQWSGTYLAYALTGLAAIALTRSFAKGKLATVSLAIVHGISGMVIFVLPFWLALYGAPTKIILVGIGGGLIGVGGLLLMFLKLEKPIIDGTMVFTLLPWLQLFMTAAFVAGLRPT